MRVQHQLLCLALVSLGLLTGLAIRLQWVELLALHCLLITAIGAMWGHNGARTLQIKIYLRDVLEPRILEDGRGGWERALAGMRVQGFLGSRWFVSTKGFLMTSQLLATVLILVMGDDSPEDIMLAVGSFLLLLSTAHLTRYPEVDDGRGTGS